MGVANKENSNPKRNTIDKMKRRTLIVAGMAAIDRDFILETKIFLFDCVTHLEILLIVREGGDHLLLQVLVCILDTLHR